MSQNTNPVDEIIAEEENRRQPKDNDRIFEKRITFNRHFIAMVHVRNQPGDDLEERDRFAYLQNLYGMNAQDMINYIYIRGRDIVEREAFNLEMSEFDRAVIQAYVGDTERREKFKKFEVLYKQMSPEDFEMLCKNERYYTDFLQEYSFRNDAISDAKRRIMWLREFLLEREGEVATDVIKIAAEHEGITRDENEWGALRSLASRYGLSTGKHGTWQWSEQAQMKFESIELTV